MQILGRHYETGRPVRLEISEGRIARTKPCDVADPDRGRLPWIAPGLIDLQVNGYAGQEFTSPDLTSQKVARIVDALGAFGVTRFCPTLTTGPVEVLTHALRTIAATCESFPQINRRIAGIHLEGPYLSPEDGPRGAHPRQHCRRPDWDEFQRLQDAAGGRIRIVTLSPEFDETPDFISRASQCGLIVGIGHTGANSAQIRAAVDSGARLSTHLGNGSHPMLPRHNNYIWDQLAEDRLSASLIVDGHHLPPAVVKTFVRAKTPGRCILVSDLAGQAGLPPGRYSGQLCEVEVLLDGRLVVAGQRELLAGASQPIGTGVANVMRLADISLAEAIAMATDHPANLLEIAMGGLQQGGRADLVLFDLARDFEVRATLVDGELVFGSV